MWKERYMHLKHYIYSPAENHWYGFNCVQMMNGDFKRGRSIGRKLIHLYHKGEQNWVQQKKKKKKENKIEKQPRTEEIGFVFNTNIEALKLKI